MKDEFSEEQKGATKITTDANDNVYESLPFDNTQSFRDAQKSQLKAGVPAIYGNDGKTVVWDPTNWFRFIKEGEQYPENQAPGTVNPSLYRQAQLIHNHAGLFEVVKDRIYQARDYDLANVTFIKGETGIIVVDPLTSTETARQALQDYKACMNDGMKVVAVIYTHSHIDHFGGVEGVTDKEQPVDIYAPEQFMKAVANEYIFAGNAMQRRAGYMYGNHLSHDRKGLVSGGLGSTVSQGTYSLIGPNKYIYINDDIRKIKIDGLTFHFQLVPNTEAPAEMHFYIEEFKALCTAENATQTLHNVYTLRGAHIRDALAWSKDLDMAIELWGDKSEVLFGVHHWPVWGMEQILVHLRKQRDTYRYINDQTIRLMNHGYTMLEIAEKIKKLPKGLNYYWADRGYYGTINHNVKSVYVKNIGWFDGNPATLHEYPPEETGTMYVELMGGAEKVYSHALELFEKGDYRWVVQLLNLVIFAKTGDSDFVERIRGLQADALEQLGYQSESGPWRNFYLTGALELRCGAPQPVPDFTGVYSDILNCLSPDLFFDYMGILLKGPDADGKRIKLTFYFTERNQQFDLTMENSVLNHRRVEPDNKTSNIQTTIMTLTEIVNQTTTEKRLAKLYHFCETGRIIIGDDEKTKLVELLALLDSFPTTFNVVTP